MKGGSHLALCIGFALPVEFLDVLREALEIWNDELVPERSRNEDHIRRDNAEITHSLSYFTSHMQSSIILSWPLSCA
jgi:hypothetical protein